MKRIVFCITFLLIGVIFVLSVRAAEMPNCSVIVDEIGDVEIQSVTGTTPVATGRADLIGAALVKTADGFLASVSTSQPFRMDPKEKGNAVFMFDTDAKEENNSTSMADVRGGSDLHYLLYPKPSSTVPWGVRRYVFIPESGAWRRTQTSSTPDVTDERISIRIPAAELPLVDPTRWRAWISVGESAAWAARDGAPTRSSEPGTCGYLPVPVSSKSGMSAVSSTAAMPIADLRPGIVAVLIAIALAGIEALMGRFRK